MRSVFILVPSFQLAGPVKGAVALANALGERRQVTMVAVKGAWNRPKSLVDRVETQLLTAYSGVRNRIEAYRILLRKAGGRGRVASISFCFSADLTNLFSRSYAVTCASVRGNLMQNYRMDYGFPGMALAATHLIALAGFDHVVAMTEAMAAQVRRFARRTPIVIGNFVDEAELDTYRQARPADGPLRFVFVGSLSRRKQPLLLLRAVHRLIRDGVALQLDIIGDGPLRTQTVETLAKLSLTEHVTVHGHLSDPYPILARADAMTLPSLSEGISRSSLEALYLGVPCVLRDVDGNRELVHSGYNGELFQGDEKLAEAMLSAARLARNSGSRRCLLPEAFREREAASKYLELVEAS